MKVTGTKEAFFKVINNNKAVELLGVSKYVISNWKRKPPSINLMEEILEKAGAMVVSEKVWDITAYVNLVFKMTYTIETQYDSNTQNPGR